MSLAVQGWVEPDRVRAAADVIYRRPEFVRAEQKSLLEIFWEWVAGLVRAADGAIPDWLRWSFYVLAGLLGLYLLAQIALAVHRMARARRAAEPMASARGARPALDSVEQRRAAHAAAARGDYASAVRALYRFAVARLHERRLVQYHESKTGGDYLRELRPRPARFELFAGFLAQVERILFGGRPCDRDLFAQLDGVAETLGDGAR